MENNVVNINGEVINDVDNVADVVENTTTAIDESTVNKIATQSFVNVVDKKITVEDFCKRVDLLNRTQSNDENKSKNLANYIYSHINVQYISYAQKCALVSNLLRATMYTTVDGNDGNSVTVFKQNSPALFMLKKLMYVDAYTDIEIHFAEHSIEDFDMLEERGLIDIIIDAVPKEEINMFEELMDMMYDDISENERSAVGVVQNFKDSVGAVMNVIIDTISEILKDKNIDNVMNDIAE